MKVWFTKGYGKDGHRSKNNYVADYSEVWERVECINMKYEAVRNCTHDPATKLVLSISDTTGRTSYLYDCFTKYGSMPSAVYVEGRTYHLCNQRDMADFGVIVQRFHDKYVNEVLGRIDKV